MRLTALGATVALVGGVFSVIAVTVTPSVAGATTNPVAASWSGSGPNCSSFVTATPPAGTVSATLTMSGGGGGGGGTNSGSGGSGGAAGEISNTTLALTHNTGIVSVKTRLWRGRWRRVRQQRLDHHRAVRSRRILGRRQGRQRRVGVRVD